MSTANNTEEAAKCVLVAQNAFNNGDLDKVCREFSHEMPHDLSTRSYAHFLYDLEMLTFDILYRPRDF